MIEKDNIQELFSKAFENHASPVRPDLWAGVQAKMSAAGVAGGGSAAVKGISALTKWIVATAAVTTIGVTTYLVTNNTDKPETKQPTPVVAANNNPASETPIQNQDNKTAPTIDKTTTVNPEQKQNSPSVEYKFNGESVTPLIPKDNEAKLIEKSPVITPTPKVIPAPVENKNPNSTGSSSSSSNENKGGGTTPPSSVSNSSNGGGTESANSQALAAKIELPNIFTPNGDGANDFCQFLKAENVKSAEITIVDQNNNPIYKTDDVSFKWDGTLPSGEQARIGIYTVLIIYTDLADKVDRIAKPIYLQR